MKEDSPFLSLNSKITYYFYINYLIYFVYFRAGFSDDPQKNSPQCDFPVHLTGIELMVCKL